MDAVAGIAVVAGKVAVVGVDFVGVVVDTVIEVNFIVSADGGVVGGEDFLGGTPLPAPTCGALLPYCHRLVVSHVPAHW